MIVDRCIQTRLHRITGWRTTMFCWHWPVALLDQSVLRESVRTGCRGWWRLVRHWSLTTASPPQSWPCPSANVWLTAAPSGDYWTKLSNDGPSRPTGWPKPNDANLHFCLSQIGIYRILRFLPSINQSRSDGRISVSTRPKSSPVSFLWSKNDARTVIERIRQWVLKFYTCKVASFNLVGSKWG